MPADAGYYLRPTRAAADSEKPDWCFGMDGSPDRQTCAELVEVYLHATPLNRIIAGFEQHGLPLAAGTLTDGMQRLAPLPVLSLSKHSSRSWKPFMNSRPFDQAQGK